MSRFRDLIDDGRVHVFDGAMGTVLYERGVFVSVCYDALASEEPELVASVHREYVRAGAEILETNTFGANPVKLSAYGLQDRTEELNEAAARVAVEAAEGRAVVVGAIGPLGIRIEPLGPTAVSEAESYFERQIRGLLAGGAEGLLLETFANLEEMRAALRAARRLTDLPIVAQMTIGEDLRTGYGTELGAIVDALEDSGADVIGLNCSVGPATMLDGVEVLAETTVLPISAQPNAGLPRTVGDRKIYLAAPDYVARYARRMIESGARFVGGCCGTTPEHIKRIRDQVASYQPREVVDPQRVDAVRVRASAGSSQDERGILDAPLPRSERSSLGALLDAGRFLRTIEFLPPRGTSIAPLVEKVDAAAEAGADAFTLVDSARSPGRMSTIAAASLLARTAPIPGLVHYTCRDRNVLGMMSDLLGAAASGLNNVLAVTGDPPRSGPYPESTAVFDIDSIGLVNLITQMNCGTDPGGSPLGAPTRFLVGVALNPGARDLERELERLRWKVSAGADFIVTQPIFDGATFLPVLDRIEEMGVPVLAGIWPLRSVRGAEFLANEVPGISVPGPVVERMRAASGEGAPAARREGLDIALEILEVLRPRVQGIHVGTPEGETGEALQVVTAAGSPRGVTGSPAPG